MASVAVVSINVRTLDGKTTKIETAPDWTVKRLKEEFGRYRGQSFDKVNFLFKGKRLKDEELLSTYKVESVILKKGEAENEAFEEPNALTKLRDCVYQLDGLIHQADASKYVDDATELETYLNVTRRKIECSELYFPAEKIISNYQKELMDLGDGLYYTPRSLAQGKKNFADAEARHAQEA